MRVLAIVPARSGSKGLTDKNIRDFAGKPLLQWTVEAALNSGEFAIVHVSTDSEKYREIALKAGADVPFLRSEANSGDKAGSWDVCREVVAAYRELGQEFDYVCLLQPTSPLRDAGDINKAFEFLRNRNAKAVVSVCRLEHSISTINSLGPDMCMEGFFDSTASGRRQDATPNYRLNGAIYIQRVEDLEAGRNIYCKDSFAYVMDKVHSVDVDDIYDFVQAEALAGFIAGC